MRRERARSYSARATAAPTSHALDPSRVLVIGCGALARELVAVIDQAGLANVDLTCLPATLHNGPGGIPDLVRARIRAARARYERVFVAYADCGTGGLLDRMLVEEGVERLPGAHCYEFYAGSAAFARMSEEEPGTFYLTDFLARNFDRLVIGGLGLDRHPELLGAYFGNYHRLVYLAQTDDPALVRAGRRAARRLGLAFELRRTGYGELASSIASAAASPVRAEAVPASPPVRPLAAGASNNPSARRQPRTSTDSLLGEQDRAARRHDATAVLRPEQETGRGRARVSRYLPSVQGSGGSLPGPQDSGGPNRGLPNPAAGVTSPGAAPAMPGAR